MRYTTVLSIDPGRDKCGVAVVSRDGVLCREIVPTDMVRARVPAILSTQNVDAIVVGDGTGSAEILTVVRELFPNTEILTVKESHSSERARGRYFVENRPRGIRRFAPRGLLYPDAPYDDLVSVILAEDFFNAHDDNSDT